MGGRGDTDGSARSKSLRFEGVMVPLLLPLDGSERIIDGDLRKHVRHLLECGVRGFLVPSGTGEFYNLPADERQHATEIVASETRGEALVVSLASDCGTRNALGHIAAARDAGADAVMMTPPYFSPVSQSVLRNFFETLAAEGGLPLWLYHQPTETKVAIEPETVARLAENRDIVGIKASGWVDMLYFQRLVRIMRCRPEFRLLMGEDFNDLSGLVLGGHGIVGTLANVLPREFVALWAAIKNQDLDTARGLQDVIMDVQETVILGIEGWRCACKLALKRMGIFSTTTCTSPSPILTADDEKAVGGIGERLHLF